MPAIIHFPTNLRWGNGTCKLCGKWRWPILWKNAFATFGKKGLQKTAIPPLKESVPTLGIERKH